MNVNKYGDPNVIEKDKEGNIILIGWNISKKELQGLIKEHKQKEEKIFCSRYIASKITDFKKPSKDHKKISNILLNKLSHKELVEIFININ